MAKKEEKKAKKLKIAKVKAQKEKKGISKVLTAIGGYLKGSWAELRQVRWPNRKSAWSLTLAVILFTTFFFLLIVLLDNLFKTLFNLILK